MENSIVLYSLNGKYFRDFDIFITESEGLTGLPKVRDGISYVWNDYDGIQISKNQTPKFEPREIKLRGWVEGNSFDDMVRKFNSFLSEFRKKFTQRLVIEPFNQKALVFDVLLKGDTDLKKEFKNGEMIGTFSLELLEPIPIKRTFKLIGSNLTLLFDAGDKWVDINIDGNSTSRKGNSDLSTVLNNRVLSHYPYFGRNFAINSGPESINNIEYLGKPIANLLTYLEVGDSFYANYDLKTPNPGNIVTYLLGRWSSSGENHDVKSYYQNFTDKLKILGDRNIHAVNLLKNSSHFNYGSNFWSNWADFSMDNWPDLQPAVLIEQSGSGYMRIDIDSVLSKELEIGKKYTFSFNISNVSNLTSSYLGNNNSSYTFPVNGNGQLVNGINKVSFIYSEELKLGGCSFFINFSGSSSFLLGYFQLEEGPDRTPWGPAESDQEYNSYYSTWSDFSFYGIYGTGRNIHVRNVFIGRAIEGQKWVPAPEEVHYITIAGEVTNLITNAEEL